LIGRLYSQAQRVLVWLGPPSEDSDIAMDALSVCEQNAQDSFREFRLRDSLEYIRKNKEAGAALLLLFNRSYWSRIWIVQEIMLAIYVLILWGSKSAHSIGAV
jgi:hypothetical protein